MLPLSTQQIVAIKTVRRHPHWGAVPESCELHPTRRHPNWGAVPERKSSVERRDFFLLHPSFSNNSSSKSSEKNSVCDFCSCATIQSTGKKITSCIGIRSIGFKIEQQALKKALQTTVLIKFDVRDWGGKKLEVQYVTALPFFETLTSSQGYRLSIYKCAYKNIL